MSSAKINSLQACVSESTEKRNVKLMSIHFRCLRPVFLKGRTYQKQRIVPTRFSSFKQNP